MPLLNIYLEICFQTTQPRRLCGPPSPVPLPSLFTTHPAKGKLELHSVMCRVSFWSPTLTQLHRPLAFLKTERGKSHSQLMSPLPWQCPSETQTAAPGPLVAAAPWCAGLPSHLGHWAAHKAPRPGARWSGLGSGYPQSARPSGRLPVPKVMQGCSRAAFVLAANPLLCVLVWLLE